MDPTFALFKMWSNEQPIDVSTPINDHLTENMPNIVDIIDTNLNESGKFEIEKNYVKDQLNDFSITVFGPPKVGKSELINAMAGSKIAQTSSGTDSTQKEIKRHEKIISFPTGEIIIDPRTNEKQDKIIERKIIFYDAPGVESWKAADLESFIDNLITKTKPMCIIVCLAPGCFAPTDKITNFVKLILKQKIWITFCLTNMYSGTDDQYNSILKSYRTIAQKLFSQELKINDTLYYYFNGLVICVDSTAYKNTRSSNESKEQFNVDMLIKYSMISLDDELIKGWIGLILGNRDMFLKIKHNLSGFFNETIPTTFTTLYEKLTIRLNYIFQSVKNNYNRNNNNNNKDGNNSNNNYINLDNDIFDDELNLLE